MRAMVVVAWRTMRVESLVVVVVALVLAWHVADLAGQLRHLVPADDHCLGQLASLDPAGQCPTVRDFSMLSIGPVGSALGLMAYLPWVLGGLMGSQVVAREIERRTAGLSWGLSGRRVRWLSMRAGLPFLVVLVATAALSIGATQLFAVRYPWLDPWQNLHDLGLWGPSVILSGLLAFGTGLAVGAIVGRQILALVMTGIACAVLLNMVGMVAPYGATQTVITSEEWDARGAWVWWEGLESREGTFATWDEASRAAPDGIREDPDAVRRWIRSNFEWVRLGVTGDRAGEVMVRHSGLLVALTLVTFGIAAGSVHRRQRMV